MPRQISRRALLAQTAALAALAPSAMATTPMATEQVPGVYRTRLGAFEITTLFDGELRRPIDDTYIRNAPFADVQAALETALLPTGFIDNPYTFTAINTGSQLILVDTGTGDLFDPSIDQGVRSLAAAGIAPEDVDLVVLTHYHPDHVGGLTNPDGSPAFPNAEILFPEVEHQFLFDPARTDRLPQIMQTFADQARTKLSAYEGRLRLITDNEEIAPGITALASPGHTAGHIVLHVESEGEELLVLGDTVTYPALFVANPNWHVVFDADGPQAAETRIALLDRAVADGARIIGYHFPFPSIGRVAATGDGFAYVPERWSGILR